MDSAGFVLEMENLDELSLIGVELVFGYALGHEPRVIVDADDGIVSRQLAREFVAVGLVHPDLASLPFVGKLGLLD